MSIYLKLTAAIVVALAALAGLSLATSKTFRVEITIPAPPDAVWAVLTDTAAYPDWNPVFVEVAGSYAEGAKLTNKVRDPDGNILEMTANVETVRPGEELRQTGGIPLVITYDHRWLLTPVDGGTRVVQHEVDRGIFLWFWNSDWIEPSYLKASEALAERVKSVAGGQ